ncbi:hypothetical protein BJY59DRAFT_282367 [Rhodotorula toruloides]
MRCTRLSASSKERRGTNVLNSTVSWRRVHSSPCLPSSLLSVSRSVAQLCVFCQTPRPSSSHTLTQQPSSRVTLSLFVRHSLQANDNDDTIHTSVHSYEPPHILFSASSHLARNNHERCSLTRSLSPSRSPPRSSPRPPRPTRTTDTTTRSATTTLTPMPSARSSPSGRR